MIVSLAELIILSILVDWAFRKLNIPGLVGMLLLGVAFGPYALGWVHPELLTASTDLRLIALIVILLRAGFELSKNTVNQVGVRVLLLAAVPAIIEGVTITFLGPPLLGLTYLQSAILGSVLAAVSPAVVVPLMIDFITRNKGTEKGLPTMVLAAAATNGVFVIVIYSILVGMLAGQDVNIAWSLAGIPISIILGVGVGVVVGLALFRVFRRFNPRATKRVLVILGLSVLLVRIEHLSAEWLPFAALLAVMGIGFVILEKDEHMAHEISAKLGKIWVFAEIALFTMVGAEVNVQVALAAGLAGAAIIGAGLIARSLGTWLCLLGSDLNRGERLFVVISYIPKATVQAAIGGGALVAMRTLLTAPLGAWAIAITGERWLAVAPPSVHDDLDAAIESEAARK
jgi:NhaP-type Na+/H+ or K+/H+ antiporter